MENKELAEVWKELRSLRALMFQSGMAIEGLQRALDASIAEFRDNRVACEQIATDFYDVPHSRRMKAIEDIILRLESSESPPH